MWWGKKKNKKELFSQAQALEENAHIFKKFLDTETKLGSVNARLVFPIPFNEGVHSSGALATAEDKIFVQAAVPVMHHLRKHAFLVCILCSEETSRFKTLSQF